MSSVPRNRALVAVLVASVVVPAVVAVIGGLAARPPSGDIHAIEADKVVVFTMPGVTWGSVEEADTPNLDRLVEQGASAALAPRSASTKPAIVRGYMTLGAGNRAAASNNATDAQLAYGADEEVDAGLTASQQLTLLVGRHRDGGIVHLGVPELGVRQGAEYHGTEIGALGEALADAGVSRGIVSAADRSDEATPPDTGRGSPVTAIVDRRGVVPDGTIRGLVERDPDHPFGVRTDRDAFVDAFEELYGDVRVAFVDAGETLRADEFAPSAQPQVAGRHAREALERTDAILGEVAERLEDGDVLIVVAPSSPSVLSREHLVPVVVWGSEIPPGALGSATTRRAGVVTLTDVAPTILRAVEAERPRTMSGRAMRVTANDAVARPAIHDELDQRSVFRERFVPSVFYTFVALFVLASILVGLVFLLRLPLVGPLIGLCYVIVSVPLATFVLSVLPMYRVGTGVAHVVLWSLALVIAGVGWIVSGPRWTGAIPLLLATASFVAADLVTGGHLLVNAVFGNSVLAAGRFYGIPNTGSALFFGATVLAAAGVGEIFRVQRGRVWLGAWLVVLLLLTGLPPFGADVGGLLTGIAAAAVIVFADRPNRIPWRFVFLSIGVAVALTLLVAFLDSLRPTAEQTHFGRFGEALFGGDATALQTIMRKASQSWASLSFSRFTYVIPLGIGALAVLLRRPQGPLRDVLPTYPLIRAALAGLLVAGVLGFALNDSGVAVPAMLLSQAVPLVVLLGLDHVRSTSSLVLDG